MSQLALLIPLDIFSWVNAKSSQGISTLQNVFLLAVLVFILYKMWTAKMAAAAVIVAGVVGALVLAIVNNIGNIQQLFNIF